MQAVAYAAVHSRICTVDVEKVVGAKYDSVAVCLTELFMRINAVAVYQIGSASVQKLPSFAFDAR